MSYLKVNTLEIAGLGAALQAAHLPFEGECASDVKSTIDSTKIEVGNFYGALDTRNTIFISHHDMTLLNALVKRGDEHAKVLRGVIVWAEIDAPIHFWWDLETYVVGHQRLLSGSTQNKECKGLKGEELLDIKDNIKFGRQVKKVDYFSYQCLRHIYFQRMTHRNPQFQEFCKWIESLPFAEELITVGYAEKMQPKKVYVINHPEIGYCGVYETKEMAEAACKDARKPGGFNYSVIETHVNQDFLNIEKY